MTMPDTSHSQPRPWPFIRGWKFSVYALIAAFVLFELPTFGGEREGANIFRPIPTLAGTFLLGITWWLTARAILRTSIRNRKTVILLGTIIYLALATMLTVIASKR